MRNARSREAAAFVSRPAATSARALVTRLAMAAFAGTGAGKAAIGPGTESGRGAVPESGTGAGAASGIGTPSGLGAGNESDTGHCGHKAGQTLRQDYRA